MSIFSDLAFEAGVVARSLADYLSGGALRLGVTGLSRAGKTVFITALVDNLVNGGKLPVLRAAAEGRIARVHLEPQPDDAVPRFPYEEHVAAIAGPERRWPVSTRRVSQLRVTIEFERVGAWGGARAQSLNLDIVDYPGEWLLDLALLDKSYGEWSRETIAAARAKSRAPVACEWNGFVAGLDPAARAEEATAVKAAELFAAYLRQARDATYALSTLPPGRFLSPGDLEGSPALTFAPLPLDGAEIAAGSLAAMMARRYEAYKTHVARPFFRDHFARLDRQIVLVDLLSALNSGPAALSDLEAALDGVMHAFRAGRASRLGAIFRPRIDRILFAATKADHLHHADHDRLEAALKLMTSRAIARAEGFGAAIDVVALAAVRATREAEIRHGGESLPAIVGTPEAGERIDGQVFDGAAEAAVFPGRLPDDPAAALAGEALALPEADNDWRFVRFRPPITRAGAPPPHIRLDRALQFLIGDRLA
ncbi:MAG: YcjX family protein [Roseiarcus sp.]|uniref:YcjX family protein n=1 Tax=Roseiarcus sp. TaxID=1969460 RepID=UPI003C1D00A3